MTRVVRETLSTVLAALTLSACGSGTSAQPSGGTVVTRTVMATATPAARAASAAAASQTAAPQGTASAQPQPAAQQPSQAPQPVQPAAPARRAGVPEGAYAGAGGPIPPGATQITSVRPPTAYSPSIAVLQSPSGNIGCDLSTQDAGCGVDSMLQTKTLGEDYVGPRWWVGLEGKPASSKGDAPWYGYSDVPAQKVHYGQVVYYLHYVCASASNGMTCWDTQTGSGAFLSRRNIISFTTTP